MKVSPPSSYEVPIPWIRISGSIIAFFSLISLYILTTEGPVELAIYLIGAIIGGWFFYEESIETFVRKRKISVDMIMTLAIIGSAYLGALENRVREMDQLNYELKEWLTWAMRKADGFDPLEKFQ